MSGHNMDQGFAAWRKQADAGLKSRYCIDFRDAGLDEEELRSYAKSFPKAVEFVS